MPPSMPKTPTNKRRGCLSLCSNSATEGSINSMNKTTSSALDDKRELLRHTVATLAYRGGKALLNAPEGFDQFRAGTGTRTPGQILAHIGDLLDWAVYLAKGEHVWRDSTPLPWEQEVARFFDALQKFDACLASEPPLGFPAERLFQGPIADALTHVGQLTILRRIAGAPIKGENYFKAEIVAGKVGSEQSTKRVDFD